jgi:hypothetical protein
MNIAAGNMAVGIAVPAIAAAAPAVAAYGSATIKSVSDIGGPYRV